MYNEWIKNFFEKKEFSDNERYPKLFQMLLESIPSSVIFIDSDLRIVLANRNFLEKSRCTLSNTIGQPLEKIFPTVILNNTDIKNRIKCAFEKNEPTTGQRMSYRVPGVSMRIYYYSILPFSWQDSVENVVLLMEDITEQVRLSEEVRLIERHLASVVESASDIVLSTDIQGQILTWNGAAEKLSGYALLETKGKFIFNYCSKEHQQNVRLIFSEIKRGQKPQTLECDLITKDSNRVPVSWVYSPMKNDNSQTIGIVAVGRDLTEQRKLEFQLLRSQKLAALGVMAGGIAHEIRNPLAVCSSAAQFLMEDDLDLAFQKECAEKIQTGIQRASLIIENLLKFARPSADTEMTQVDITTVLKETLTLVANQAKLQKIEIFSSIPKKTLSVHGIASLLQQVFVNLLLNAINAMPNGGFLEVTLNQTLTEVSISICDTGCGISKTQLSRIFDPFYTTSAVGKGTGLGLSICYSIIKQHLGNIEVESLNDHGSTFTIHLPLL